MSGRVIEITIDGEPVDHRTLDIIERGVAALKDQWDKAYEVLSDDVPVDQDTLNRVVSVHDELQRLENDLNAAKHLMVTKRTFGIPR